MKRGSPFSHICDYTLQPAFLSSDSHLSDDINYFKLYSELSLIPSFKKRLKIILCGRKRKKRRGERKRKRRKRLLLWGHRTEIPWEGCRMMAHRCMVGGSSELARRAAALPCGHQSLPHGLAAGTCITCAVPSTNLIWITSPSTNLFTSSPAPAVLAFLSFPEDSIKPFRSEACIIYS